MAGRHREIIALLEWFDLGKLVTRYSQFLRFGCVGTVGFAVDAMVVWVFHARLGAVLAQVCGFILAVTATWLLNRHWTFAGRGSSRLMWEWGRYVLANGWGALLNNGVYVLAIGSDERFAHYPVMAVALGSLMGMVANYLALRYWIFAQKKENSKKPL
ncbi:MAG: GtrA family protein [Betaproteobacteria bacterium]|nr:GtrA family protein [Betaproteobacteria bacterium]